MPKQLRMTDFIVGGEVKRRRPSKPKRIGEGSQFGKGSRFPTPNSSEDCYSVVKELRKKRALESVSKLTAALVDNLNSSVSIAYSNQRKIDAEAKALQSNAAQFAKQSTQWLKMMEEFSSALKEIGDVENWSKSIEADMLTISSTLEYIYKGGLPKH